jgi:hypothetical protein
MWSNFRMKTWTAILFLAWTGAASAQVDCPDPRAKACRNHVGCNYVISTRPTCETGKAFLGRLEKVLSGREITNNDVFEAAMPPVTDPGVAKFAAEARRAAAADKSTGRLENRSGKGNASYYEGGTQGSLMHGAGVFINDDGAMARGQFANGRPNGIVHYVLPDGSMRAGAFKDSAPQGTLARQAGVARAAPPASSGPEARNDDLVEVSLDSRWKGDGSGATLRVSLASYLAAEKRRADCGTAFEASRCSVQAIYRYQVGAMLNPWQPTTVSYAGKEEPAPACKFTPRRHSPVPIRLRKPEDTCRDQLMLAVHDGMQPGAVGTEALLAWGKGPALPNTSSGNCKADLDALDQAVNAIRARRPNFPQGQSSLPNTQFTMFIQGQRYRVLQASCKGQREAENLPRMRRNAGDLFAACAQQAGDASLCSARIPW